MNSIPLSDGVSLMRSALRYNITQMRLFELRENLSYCVQNYPAITWLTDVNYFSLLTTIKIPGFNYSESQSLSGADDTEGARRATVVSSAGDLFPLFSSVPIHIDL